jgi:hypothetical protein
MPPPARRVHHRHPTPIESDLMTVGLIELVLRDTPALPGALCRGEHQLFDSTEPVDVASAIELCGWCPAITACSAWADRMPRNKLLGVVAGRLYEHTPPTARSRKAVA